MFTDGKPVWVHRRGALCEFDELKQHTRSNSRVMSWVVRPVTKGVTWLLQ